MARYQTEIDVNAPADEVFAYLSDFSTTAEWDPGVRSAEKLGDGPPAVGSRFSVTSGFYGRSVELEYVITELDPEARRVVLEGTGKAVTGRDVITVRPTGEGTSVVDYDASVSLTGVFRVLDKGLQLAFNGIGDNAADGLRSRFA